MSGLALDAEVPADEHLGHAAFHVNQISSCHSLSGRKVGLIVDEAIRLVRGEHQGRFETLLAELIESGHYDEAERHLRALRKEVERR